MIVVLKNISFFLVFYELSGFDQHPKRGGKRERVKGGLKGKG
jgi:hypothetical protein